MAIEQGVVTRLSADAEPATAWVKIVRTGACESCGSRHSCAMGKGDPADEVEALDPLQVRIGDRVQVTLSTGSLLKATFLLYLFPILCMILGGSLGHWLSPRLNRPDSATSMVLAMVFFAVAMIIVRTQGRRMGLKNDYRPRILRVIGHGSLAKADSTPGSCDKAVPIP